MKILIVEDDPDLNKNIKEALQAEGFIVENAFDGQIGLRLLKKEKYDCVVLDINLPLVNGIEVCKNFRAFNTSTPIIILTAFSELEDKIGGYNAGADDYLTKPFFVKELILRIHSLLNRSKQKNTDKNTEILLFDDIVLNKRNKKVTRNNKDISLTFREYQIISLLMEKQGEIATKREILKEIWGSSYEGNTNTIEVYINFLRNKFDKPFQKSTIKTKVGYGYYLE